MPTLKSGYSLVCATLVLASVAHAEPYREMVPHPPSVPSVSGDFTDTYRYWKDPENLSPAMRGSANEEWKLNWKFMDPPANDTLHGGHMAQDRGEELYEKLNKNGDFAKCIGAKGGDLTGLRANQYPQFNKALGRVVGLEAMIEHCANKQGMKLLNGSHDNSAVAIYIGTFSDGMPMNLDVSKGPLKESFERGEKLFHMRTGWTNFACATCHVSMVGHHLRGQVPTTPYGDAAHWPTFRTKDEIQSLHVRFTECNRNGGTQPLAIGSPEYTDLEVYLTALSNGQPVVQPSVRN